MRGGRPRSDLSIAVPRALRRRMTPHEVKLWNWLRESVAPLGYHFRRQVPIDRLIVDFACLKSRLIVEIDGEQHGREAPIREADRRRDEAIATLDYRVLRFTNQDVDRRKDVVLETILAALEGRLDDPHPTATQPDPPPQGEVAGAKRLTEGAPAAPRTPPGSAFGRVRPPLEGRDQARSANGAD